MPDRHSGLPAHPDLEYYRKQAKHLQRSYEAGDAAARDRAAEVLGDRAAERFLLSDAQFVLAQEHGFRTWAEFRADIQSQETAGDRPVSRLWGQGSGGYASQAVFLLTDLRRGGCCRMCRWPLDLRRRLRPCGDKTVPGLAVGSGSCRLIWSEVARALRAAPAFPQNWAFSSSILPMCSRSWA